MCGIHVNFVYVYSNIFAIFVDFIRQLNSLHINCRLIAVLLHSLCTKFALNVAADLEHRVADTCQDNKIQIYKARSVNYLMFKNVEFCLPVLSLLLLFFRQHALL